MSIHAKKTEDGLRYRVWSGVVDSYVTPEMTEAQVLRWLIEDSLERTIRKLGEEFERVECARKRGTSSYHDSRDFDAWESELPDDESTFRDERGDEAELIHDDPEKYIAGEFTKLLTRWREEPPRIDGKRVQVAVSISLVDEDECEP